MLNLTDVNEQMIQRRRDPAVKAAVLDKRYASVPALYFRPDRSWRALGTPMGLPSFVRSLVTKMPRPHDGIVSEDRNDVTRRGSTNFAEFDLARFDGATPARAHAPHIAARDLDRVSILDSREIAALVAKLIETADWKTSRLTTMSISK